MNPNLDSKPQKSCKYQHFREQATGRYHPPPQPTPLRVLTGAHDRIINGISKILGKTHGQIRACVELGFRVLGFRV